MLSLAMRYFFTIIGVMIVWRSFSWLRKDRKQTHRRLKQLPDAGSIGILTVEQGNKHLKPGAIIPVPHEGVLGYLRTCDVVVPVTDVATMHLDFTFINGKGLFVYPRRGCEAVVDGILLTSRRDSLRHPLQHGSVLEVGQAVLRLGVFAGLNVPDAQPAFQAEVAPFPQENPWQPDMPQPWNPADVPPPASPEQAVPPPYAPSWYTPMNPQQQAWRPPAPPDHSWPGGDDHAP